MKVIILFSVFTFFVMPTECSNKFPQRGGQDQSKYFQRWNKKRK